MQQSKPNTGPSQRAIERIVGILLLAYVVLVAVQVTTRVMAYDSRIPFYEAFLTIFANLHLYLTSMYSGLAANLLLVLISAGLYSIFAVYQINLARVGAFLLLGAAIVSLMSSGAGLALASLVQEFSGESVQALRPGSGLTSAQTLESIRASFGRIGFTLSAVGVITLASLIASVGALPKWLGWVGIAAGVLMFFIWVDTAAIVHRLGGLGYLLWLALAGGWLLTRGTRTVPND